MEVSIPLSRSRAFWQKCWKFLQSVSSTLVYMVSSLLPSFSFAAVCLNLVDGVHTVGPDSDILVTDTEKSLHLTHTWCVQGKLNIAVLHLTTSRQLGKCCQTAAGQVPAKPSGSYSSFFVFSCCLRIISILSAHFWHNSDIQERSEVVGLHPSYWSSEDCSCWSIKEWC